MFYLILLQYYVGCDTTLYICLSLPFSDKKITVRQQHLVPAVLFHEVAADFDDHCGLFTVSSSSACTRFDTEYHTIFM